MIDDPDREFVITEFLKMELLLKATFGNRENEISFYNEFFDHVVHQVDITRESVAGAFQIACQFGLSAIDSFHVHSAQISSVSEFITTEKQTKPFFRIVDTTLKLISISEHEEIND